MKIPKNLYDKKQLEALSLNGVNFDFDKDYSNAEISDVEEKIGDIICDHSYSKDLEFYEQIIDSFVKFQEETS